MEKRTTVLAFVLLLLLSMFATINVKLGTSWSSPVVAAATATTTSVSFSLGPISEQASVPAYTPITCIATVSGSDPTGTVTWNASSSTGSFSQLTCTLSSDSNCSTTYADTTPNIANITATYLGDPSHALSSGSANLTVYANLTVSVSTGWNLSEDPYNELNYGSWWSAGGNCYGLSTTMILYFMHCKLNNMSCPYFPAQDPPANSTFQLMFSPIPYSTTVQNYYDSENYTLTNASLAVMFHQVYGQWMLDWRGTLNEAYGKLVAALESGTPALLGMVGVDSDNASVFVGHAVVAYAIEPLQDGTVNITLSDPNRPPPTEPNVTKRLMLANYNPSTQTFSYFNGAGNFSWFQVFTPEVIDTSWFNCSKTFLPSYNASYLPSYPAWEWQVPNYTIVCASNPIKIVNGTSMDYFNTPGDSGSFQCGISNSTGIEEGTVQVYAIPNDTEYQIVHPWNLSMINPSDLIMATWLKNSSRRGEFFGWVLNATGGAQGLPYDFTATPSDSGLVIKAGANGLNGSVTFFYATSQDHSVFQTPIVPVAAGQTVSFNVASWQTLNSTAFNVVSVALSKTVVGRGLSLPLNMTIMNVGDLSETLNVTLYSNTTTLGTETNINISNGTSKTLTFTWNTAAFALGNYNLNACAWPVSGETNTANNCTCGQITITIVGDVNGDFKVDLKDLVILAKAYGSKPGDANWNPNADMATPWNGISLSDLVALAVHYGQHYP